MESERNFIVGSYVEIIGASCSGKTTTAGQVSRRTGTELLRGNENVALGTATGEFVPFNEGGEAEPELRFLEYHQRVLRGVQEKKEPDGIVADASIRSDLAYALHYLKDDELARFLERYAQVDAAALAADFTVMLSVPASELVARKQRRHAMFGRADDAHPDVADLSGIQQSHESVTEHLGDDRAAVLRVKEGEPANRVTSRSLNLLWEKL